MEYIYGLAGEDGGLTGKDEYGTEDERESSVDGLCPGAVPISVQSVLTPPTESEIDATRPSDLARIYAQQPR